MAMKIISSAERIIFSGHADTRDECETITLMCDSLAKDPNFKTVRYEDGYAEFEKVGTAGELKFIGAPAELTINFDAHITKVSGRFNGSTLKEWTTSGSTQTGAANDGETYYFTVTLEDGYVIDTISGLADQVTIVSETEFGIVADSGGIYGTITITSKLAPTPTISFTRRYQNSTLIGTGTYKFRRYSVEEPVPQLAAPVITASDTSVNWEAVANAESYDVYVDGELYENTTGEVTYNITTTVMNGTYSGDTTITDTATVTITANTGYTLPDSVTVTGASQTWNKETGMLTLTNPTGNVTVEAVCVKTTYTLKFTGGNSSMSGTLNGEEITRYTEYTLKNGDVITLKAAGSEDHYLVDHYYKGNVIIDDTKYSSNSTITIKNKDIYATSELSSSSSNISTTITINFVIE